MTESQVSAKAQGFIGDINSAGELPLTARRKLRESVIALLPDDALVQKFSALLGLACAERAWPMWQSAFPADSRPMDLAQSAVSAVFAESPREVRVLKQSVEVGVTLGKVKADLDGKFLLGEEYFPAIYSGFAAWAVARDVFFGEDSNNEPGVIDFDIDPEEWDPCFFASIAVTGSATWENVERDTSDTRREFWDWYLSTAVPDAFAAAV